ncbi:unnamed protein product [Rotaria sordida]|uniref:Uncharacterized protein n=1 Tax=Rotaria sordida TaxID=392033 RepID=A0A819ZUT7_9BILA|nr:unnamed protein product [Rotaria sordida]
MSTVKRINDVDVNQYKNSFSTSQLIIGLVIGTYFLTVELIDFSLSMYVLREKKPELYQEYIMFKSQAPIWKWWQLCTMIVLPLSMIDALRDLIHMFTKKATIRRNVIDILKAIQFFGIVYTMFVCVMPLESHLAEKPSKHLARDLNFYHSFAFGFNILGWLLTLLRYYDWKNDKQIPSEKKTQ